MASDLRSLTTIRTSTDNPNTALTDDSIHKLTIIFTSRQLIIIQQIAREYDQITPIEKHKIPFFLILQ